MILIIQLIYVDKPVYDEQFAGKPKDTKAQARQAGNFELIFRVIYSRDLTEEEASATIETRAVAGTTAKVMANATAKDIPKTVTA